MIDGITTNPSLIAKTGQNFIDVIGEITNIVNGPISAEVIATSSKEMIQEGQKLAKISPSEMFKENFAKAKDFLHQNVKTYSESLRRIVMESN